MLWPFYFVSALASLKPRRSLKYSQLSYTDDAQVAGTYPGPDTSLPLVFFLLWLFAHGRTRQGLSLLDLSFLFPVTDENTELRLLCRLSISVWCQQCPGSDRGHGHAGLCLWDHSQPMEMSKELTFSSALISGMLPSLLDNPGM